MRKPTKAQLTALRQYAEVEDRGDWCYLYGNDKRINRETARILVYDRGWVEEYIHERVPIGYCARLTAEGRRMLALYKGEC